MAPDGVEGGGAATITPPIPADGQTLLDGATQPAGEGGDTVETGTGNDTIDGGTGNDSIESGTGNDTVETGTGNDSIDGGTGNDGIPETYELTAAEGVALDPVAVEAATPIFKELGLNNEQAQKVVDLYQGSILPHVATAVQAQTLELLGMGDIANWAQQVRDDKDIGGANLEANLALAAKGRDALATPELRQLLESTRLGNHPQVVKLFAKIGQTIAEDTIVPGGAGGGEPRPNHEVFYSEEFQPKS